MKFVILHYNLNKSNGFCLHFFNVVCFTLCVYLSAGVEHMLVQLSSMYTGCPGENVPDFWRMFLKFGPFLL